MLPRGPYYPRWRQELGLPDMAYGAFGENFTVAHQDETTVCIGDTYRVGEAIVQVSQPRQPCWKPARRWRVKDLALRMQQEGRTGWYFGCYKKGASSKVMFSPCWSALFLNGRQREPTTSCTGAGTTRRPAPSLPRAHSYPRRG